MNDEHRARKGACRGHGEHRVTSFTQAALCSFLEKYAVHATVLQGLAAEIISPETSVAPAPQPTPG